MALLLSGQVFDILFSDIVMPGRHERPRSGAQRHYARTTGDVYREGFNIIAKPYSVDSLAEALRRTVAEAEEAARTAHDTA